MAFVTFDAFGPASGLESAGLLDWDLTDAESAFGLPVYSRNLPLEEINPFRFSFVTAVRGFFHRKMAGAVENQTRRAPAAWQYGAVLRKDGRKLCNQVFQNRAGSVPVPGKKKHVADEQAACFQIEAECA